MGRHSPGCVCLPVFRLPRAQQALRELVDRFAGYSLRLNTHLAYESRQRIFRSICASMRINPAAPITELQLCGVCILYAHQHRITSLPGFISAIAHYAMRTGLPDLPRGRTFDRVKAGLFNWYGDTSFSEPARGFTLDDLRAIRAHVNPGVFADARDWCAALFAFFGLLRIKEYTCSGLLREHVSVHPWGISLANPFSKTVLVPTAVAIVRRDDDRLHQPPCDYSGHLFRRGGTTALQIAGVPESTIASHGRWKSLAYRSYFDVQFNLHLRLAATAQLSLYDSRRLDRAPPLQT